MIRHISKLETPAKLKHKHRQELQIVEVKAAAENSKPLVEVTGVAGGSTSAKNHPVLTLKRAPFRGNLITRGQLVEVAKTEPQPSAFWYDPHCAISGIVRDDGETDHPKSYRLRIRGEERESATLGGLCIPSYGVPVEFREVSYVRSELGGALKK